MHLYHRLQQIPNLNVQDNLGTDFQRTSSKWHEVYL